MPNGRAVDAHLLQILCWITILGETTPKVVGVRQLDDDDDDDDVGLVGFARRIRDRRNPCCKDDDDREEEGILILSGRTVSKRSYLCGVDILDVLLRVSD
mmetsp:Transcript_24025/g.35464  ORF Transcript_24025/g.35464 Transcript_24025/m.35464 type:complete len:100 (-) Transcript_24025:118-417(-)